MNAFGFKGTVHTKMTSSFIPPNFNTTSFFIQLNTKLFFKILAPIDLHSILLSYNGSP